MIHTSGIYGGGRSGSATFGRLIAIVDHPFREADAQVFCVFHVPGSISSPEFSGILLDRYYRDPGFIGIDIAVPLEFVNDENTFNRNSDFLLKAKAFIIDSIRRSVGLAAEYFAKKNMPFDEKAANECVDLMDHEMTLEKMKEAVAPPRRKPPSQSLLDRVKKASTKRK